MSDRAAHCESARIARTGEINSKYVCAVRAGKVTAGSVNIARVGESDGDEMD